MLSTSLDRRLSLQDAQGARTGLGVHSQNSVPGCDKMPATYTVEVEVEEDTEGRAAAMLADDSDDMLRLTLSTPSPLPTPAPTPTPAPARGDVTADRGLDSALMGDDATAASTALSRAPMPSRPPSPYSLSSRDMESEPSSLPPSLSRRPSAMDMWTIRPLTKASLRPVSEPTRTGERGEGVRGGGCQHRRICCMRPYVEHKRGRRAPQP
jgi:hypothetical protein